MDRHAGPSYPTSMTLARMTPTASAVAILSLSLEACGAPERPASAPPAPVVSASPPAFVMPLPDDPCVRACERGRGPACFEAVVRMAKAGVDREARLTVLERACTEMKEARACFALGHISEEMPGKPKATKALERACELSLGIACTMRVIEGQEGSMARLAPDAERATLERACEAEHGVGCEKLQALLESLPPASRDEAHIREVHQRACDNGGTCTGFAQANREGRYQREALAIYEAACARGAGWGCVGIAERELAFTEKDPAVQARGRERLRGACEAGYRWGCARYADVRVRGRGGPADRESGLEALRKLCVDGYEPACNMLGELHQPAPSACDAP